jgi:hypothetical protein
MAFSKKSTADSINAKTYTGTAPGEGLAETRNHARVEASKSTWGNSGPAQGDAAKRLIEG